MPFRLAAALLPLLALPSLAQSHRLYDEAANPDTQIATATATAQREHKNILLEFGGNWCADCYVLDALAHQPPNADLVAQSFLVVHIDIGHIDRNLNIARRYHTPIDHGVPGIAILDSHGKLLYAQQPKEFEHTTPEALHALLTRYQPTPAHASAHPGSSAR